MNIERRRGCGSDLHRCTQTDWSELASACGFFALLILLAAMVWNLSATARFLMGLVS